MKESETQKLIRLEAPKLGVQLWRNNKGAFYNNAGRLIRYGLANDSKKMSNNIKSHDLIGLTQYIIKPEDVGRNIAIFTSVEVKPSNWVFKATAPERAQLKWSNLIKKLGGRAFFATSPKDLYIW